MLWVSRHLTKSHLWRNINSKPNYGLSKHPSSKSANQKHEGDSKPARSVMGSILLCHSWSCCLEAGDIPRSPWNTKCLSKWKARLQEGSQWALTNCNEKLITMKELASTGNKSSPLHKCLREKDHLTSQGCELQIKSEISYWLIVQVIRQLTRHALTMRYFGLISGGPMPWIQMKSYVEKPLQRNGQVRNGSYIVLDNESSAYSVSQAQKHQKLGNFPRMVCKPKSNGPGEDLGKNEWKRYPKNVFIFCIQLPLKCDLIMEWSIVLWKGGGGEDAIGNKTLDQTWVSEIRSQSVSVWSTRTQYKWLHVLYGREIVFCTSKISEASASSYFTLHPISPPPTKMHHSYPIVY